MTLPDNRIKLQAPKIDFDADVGTTGQNHDNYPPEGGQARFDHLRSVVIGLLSNQSSYDEPTEKRDGTLWFDLNVGALRIWRNSSWEPISNAIAVAEDATGNITTLTQWFDSIIDNMATIAPEIVFNGYCTRDFANSITIPESLRAYLYSDSRVFLYVNGLLIDPRDISLTPTQIQLSGITLNSDDIFTVKIRRIPNATYYVSNVVAQ